jgi:predicted DNA-binding WGR domain protein
MWEARELHCIGNGHDKFYRIIQAGPVVVIRYGRRGTEGQRQVKVFNSSHEANYFFNDTVENKRWRRNYTVVYTDRRPRDVAVPTQEDEIERDYLTRYPDVAPVQA